MINPFAKDWEAERIFPAHQVFKKFGEAGLLGIHRYHKDTPTKYLLGDQVCCRDEEYGGQGLDYKYNCAFLEALGHSDSSGIAMAIGVIEGLSGADWVDVKFDDNFDATFVVNLDVNYDLNFDDNFDVSFDVSFDVNFDVNFPGSN